jgi:hypothetical protein
MDEKKLVIIITVLLIFGFFSLFIVIVPWLSWARSPNWEAVAIDNLLMGLIAAAIGYGIYIGSKTM